jgi:hypothetical protein
MIKQIIPEQILEDVVKFRDRVTVTISQNIPQPIINEFRIVKQGTGGNMTKQFEEDISNDRYSVIDGYKNLTNTLFKRKSNFVRYLNNDNKYIIIPISKNNNNSI